MTSAQDWLDSIAANLRRPKASTSATNSAGDSLTLPTLVGLTGKAGAGKDTLAKYLAEHHGYATVSFAAALKRGLEAMFGIPLSVWEDRVAKERVIDWIGKSPRQLAQTLGTEWGRVRVADDIWITVLARDLLKHVDRRVVVTDVRYNNEAEMIKKLGGHVIRIERPVAENVNEHSSEAGVHASWIDARVSNDSTIQAAQQALLKKLLLLA